ncbi:MAG: hypothetical protein QOG72_1676 [Sphingomonadales bacterium]|jgi:ABC-type dipeptide/oligopeptide/nickel transport system ATPase component|nr:hypothetical protein [Sphingomonadales bacterium]
MKMGEPAATIAQPSRPYPGLRPFSRREANVFFGRDRCIDGMATTLQESRFLAVLGPSGSGKSSLVRSGLFQYLSAGLARKAGSRWTFLDIKHPRTQPYRELAKVTLEASLEAERLREGKKARERPPPSAEETAACELELRRDPLALLRWWRDTPHHEDANLILLVDQFEELFGYSNVKQRDDVEKFIDLLLHSIGKPEIPIYVVLTMRSEFLGGCSLFPDLAAQINRSLSLTPRMTRAECELAIRGPAVIHKSLQLEDALVTKLLNDMNSLAKFDEPDANAASGEEDAAAAELRQADLIARRADQLPLMQHVLNWMWTKARGPGEAAGPVLLTLDSYHRLGGLKDALRNHALEVMAEDRTDHDLLLTSQIFRALTDQPSVATGGSAESTAVRRPRTIAQIAEETEATEEEVKAIVEKFRAQDVSMLTPDPGEALESTTEVDISHESIIRQWSELRDWIRYEAEMGRGWQQLRNDYRQERPLFGLELADRVNWWNRSVPRQGWSRRYVDNASDEGEYKNLYAYLEGARRRHRVRQAFLYAGTAVLVVIGVGFGASSFRSQAVAAEAEKAQERAVLAQLTAEAAERRAKNDGKMAKLGADRIRQVAALEANQARQQTLKALAEAERSQRLKAAAEKTASVAAAAMVSARAEAATIARERDQVTNVLGSDISSSYGDIIEVAAAQTPEQASPTLENIGGRLEHLRKIVPGTYREVLAKLMAAQGDVARLGLDTSSMQGIADRVREDVAASGEPVFEAGDPQALLLGQAELMRGRALRLKGEDEAALVAFAKAQSLLPANGPEPFRLARAEAAYEQAAAQLDRGSTREAGDTARACLGLVKTESPGVSRAGSPLPEVPAGPVWHLADGRCRMILAASMAAGDEAANEWDKAAKYVQAGPEQSNGVALARYELVTRYLRRPDFQFSDFDSVSPYMTEIVANVVGTVGLEDGGSPAIAFRSPLDAIERASAINGIIAAYLKRGPEGPDELRQAHQLIGASGSLLNRLAQSRAGVDNPHLVGRVSQGLFDNTANLVEITRYTDAQSFETLQNVPAEAAALLQVHASYLASLPPEVAGAYRQRLLRQGLEVLEAGARIVRWLPYGTLGGIAESLPSSLCGAPAEGGEAECDSLRSRAASLVTVEARMISTLRAAAARKGGSSDPVWEDSKGIALGGADPVACYEAAGMAAGAANPAQNSVSQTVDAFTGPRNRGEGGRIGRCFSLRPGNYNNALPWGGQIWLFANERDRRAFETSPGSYLPRFGGYDFAGIAKNDRTLSSSVRYGNVVDGRLYLSGTYLDDEAVRRDSEAAERNWPALRRPAEAAGPAGPAPRTP